MLDLSRERVGGAEVILRFIAKKRCHITKRREADPEHRRILRRENDLIQELRIEAIFQANLCGVRSAGKWISRVAFGPRPVGRRHHGINGDFAVHGFVFDDGERCFLCVEVKRLVRQRIDLHHQRLRVWAATIDDASQHFSADRRAVRVFRYGYDDKFSAGFVVRGVASVLALPTAAEPDVAHVTLRGDDREPPTAIRNVVPHETAHLGRIGRHDELKCRDVFHFARRVSRRQRNVLDDRVARMRRIKLAICATANALDRARRAGGRERGVGIERRLDHDFGDAGIGADQSE